MSFIAAKPQPSLLVPSIHDSTPCDSPWILTASSFAFPKMLPELLWLLLDESGKGQKQLFPLECEGAGTGKVEGWSSETAISRSLRGKITWLLGQSQEMGRANCFAPWDGSWILEGQELGMDLLSSQVHLLPRLCSTADLCWKFTRKLRNSTQPLSQKLREPGSGAELRWQLLIGGQGV